MKQAIIFFVLTLVLGACVHQKQNRTIISPAIIVKKSSDTTRIIATEVADTVIPKLATVGKRIPPPQDGVFENFDLKINPEDTIVQYELKEYEHYTLAVNGKQYIKNKTSTPIEFLSINRGGERMTTIIGAYSHLAIGPEILNFPLANANVTVKYAYTAVVYQQE